MTRTCLVAAALVAGVALAPARGWTCDMANCNEQKSPGSCTRARAAYSACLQSEKAARARDAQAAFQREHQKEIDAARAAGSLNSNVNRGMTPTRNGANVGAVQ